jgi:hypothetical protein
MPCLRYQSAAMIEHPDCNELGYHRFRGYSCKRVIDSCTGTLFKGLQYPMDLVCLVVFRRVRHLVRGESSEKQHPQNSD